MIKYRILTGAILLPLFVFLLFYLPPLWFCGLTGFFVVLGAWEWSYFLGVKRFLPSLIYPTIVFWLIYAAFLLPVLYILYAGFIFWLIAILLILLYPRSSRVWGKSYFLRGIMGIMVLIPCWLSLNFLRNAENGIAIILYIFILIWVADSTAFFVGRKWGNHKIIPKVSPGKSYEGLFGALIAICCVVIVTIYLLQIPSTVWPYAFILSIATFIFSVVGDLFESMLKRNVDLKDSGRLLPGHGGILDRIDSLTAAAPIFTLGAIWLQ